MKTAYEADLDRCVDAAFSSVQKDIKYWNDNVAGTRKYPWSGRGDVEKPIEFSHRWWAIDTLWELMHNGFTIDERILLRVQQLTHSDKMNSD